MLSPPSIPGDTLWSLRESVCSEMQLEIVLSPCSGDSWTPALFHYTVSTARPLHSPVAPEEFIASPRPKPVFLSIFQLSCLVNEQLGNNNPRASLRLLYTSNKLFLSAANRAPAAQASSRAQELFEKASASREERPACYHCDCSRCSVTMYK